MIPGLPQVGPMELLIILAVVLLFVGAKRIPELARSLGRGIREFRKGLKEGASGGEMTGSEEEQDKAPPSAAGDRESPHVGGEQTATVEHKAQYQRY
jgi:sec-independent protein translocase protein TatA